MERIANGANSSKNDRLTNSFDLLENVNEERHIHAGDCFILFCWVTIVDGQDLKLDAPSNWRSESINLPPGFAPKLNLKGKALVYFSPGWPKPDSDQFFTYTFLFQTEAEPKLNAKVIENELLAYFGGLASAVSGGKVDPATFKMSIKEAKNDSKDKPDSENSKRFEAQLKWTEPFFTKSEQTLHMKMVSQFNPVQEKNYLMVCASPQDPNSESEASSKVWQQLKKIQSGFSNSQKSDEATEGSEKKL